MATSSMVKSLLLFCLPLAIAVGPARRVNIRKSDKSRVQVKTNAVVGVDARANAFSAAGSTHQLSASSAQASLWSAPGTGLESNSDAGRSAKADHAAARANINANAKARAATLNKKGRYWLKMVRELEERKKLLPTPVAPSKSRVRHARRKSEGSGDHIPTERLVNTSPQTSHAANVKADGLTTLQYTEKVQSNNLLLETAPQSESAAALQVQFPRRPRHNADLTEGAHVPKATAGLSEAVILPIPARDINSLSRLPSISIRHCVIGFGLIMFISVVMLYSISYFEVALAAICRQEEHTDSESEGLKKKVRWYQVQVQRVRSLHQECCEADHRAIGK
jgi:hypothetical protein